MGEAACGCTRAGLQARLPPPAAQEDLIAREPEAASPDSSWQLGRVARLEARVDVEELLARYCWALDTRDEDAFLEEFTSDVEFRRTDDGSLGRGSRALWGYIIDILGPMGPTLHVTTANLLVEVSGELVSSRHLGLAEHSVGDELVVAALSYHHDYRRGSDGRLRISRRAVVPWYFSRACDLARHYGDRRRFWWNGVTPARTLPHDDPAWQRFHARRSKSCDG